jgi:hypothetical protein
MELQLAEAVANGIGREYMRASRKCLRLHSAHEGAAVLKEKYDILWEEVKRVDVKQTRAAAIRLAATALRFVVDTCPPSKTNADAGANTRKPMDPGREKEITAFERWQMGEPWQAGLSSRDHLARRAHAARRAAQLGNVAYGGRPKRPRCRAREAPNL